MRPARPTLLVVDDDRLLRRSIRQALIGHGLEFARQAKGILPDLKIFVMTAFDLAAAPRQAFEGRAEGYLPKPFEMSTLRDMMASHW